LVQRLNTLPELKRSLGCGDMAVVRLTQGRTDSRKILRGEVYWVNLDPTVGTEIQKTRPAVVVSPKDMNASLPRVIIAPLTSAGNAMACRPEVVFQGKLARILLDQLRSVDTQRLTRKMGNIDAAVWHSVLLEMLA
jgi:mRNA interferase MazF